MIRLINDLLGRFLVIDYNVLDASYKDMEKVDDIINELEKRLKIGVILVDYSRFNTQGSNSINGVVKL